MTDKLLEVALCSLIPHNATGVRYSESMQSNTRTELNASTLSSFLDDPIFKIELRPINCLTKPITVPNYNQGKEFVPIVELAKRFHVNHKYEVTHYDQVKHQVEAKAFVVNCCVKNDSTRYNYYVVSYKNIDDIPVGVTDLLNQWLIDWRDLIGKGLAVEIVE